jgi:hypothetical protein
MSCSSLFDLILEFPPAAIAAAQSHAHALAEVFIA